MPYARLDDCSSNSQSKVKLNTKIDLKNKQKKNIITSICQSRKMLPHCFSQCMGESVCQV